jgi:hypothetical protein
MRNSSPSSKSSHSYWIPGSEAPTLSEKGNAFLRPWKNKGFKEERVTRMRLDSLSTSTPLESNKCRERNYRPSPYSPSTPDSRWHGALPAQDTRWPHARSSAPVALRAARATSSRRGCPRPMAGGLAGVSPPLQDRALHLDAFQTAAVRGHEPCGAPRGRPAPLVQQFLRHFPAVVGQLLHDFFVEPEIHRG